MSHEPPAAPRLPWILFIIHPGFEVGRVHMHPLSPLPVPIRHTACPLTCSCAPSRSSGPLHLLQSG